MRKRLISGMIVLSILSIGWYTGLSSRACHAAEEKFPTKEITIVVNYAAGGGRDILARGLGKVMSKHLGVPIVVLNMPGAGGARGLIHLYHSEPDGYNIGIAGTPEVIDQIVQKQEYDNKKFTYLGRAQSSPMFLYVKSDSPFRTLKDFKAYGKPVRESAISMTTPNIVASMILAKREDFPLTIVGGYQGAAAVLLALIRGEVELTGSPMSAASAHVRSGQIRPMLAIHEKRHPDFPDIPTIGEAGHKDLSSLSLDYWFVVPPATPKPRVQVLENALLKSLNDPEFLAWAKGAGVDPGPLNGEEMTKMISDLFSLFEQYKGDIEKYMKK